MGNGIEFTCKKCGHTDSAMFGVGFLFPDVYQNTVSEIKAGKYGSKWKELFEQIPGAAVNAEEELYVCPACGGYASEPNLTIYEPKDPAISKVHNEVFAIANPASGQEYVVPWELAGDYRRVKVFVHKCPECGKRMHKYRAGDRLRCPKCRQGWMEETGYLNWD